MIAIDRCHGVTRDFNGKPVTVTPVSASAEGASTKRREEEEEEKESKERASPPAGENGFGSADEYLLLDFPSLSSLDPHDDKEAATVHHQR